jgi:hypothetical protein
MDDCWCTNCRGTSHGNQDRQERRLLQSVHAIETINAIVAASKVDLGPLVTKLAIAVLGRPKDSVTTLDFALKKVKNLVAEDERYQNLDAKNIAEVVAEVMGDISPDLAIADFLSSRDVYSKLRRSGLLYRQGDLGSRFQWFKDGTFDIRSYIPMFRTRSLITK